MLEGLKVVELATYVAGPSAAALMSDWGAEVIKVESGRGDPTRRTFAGQAHLEGNPVFEFENHGKRGIVLDTAKPAGREALLRLLDDADIFVTNLRPGALKRAHLDYDSLKARLPRLIYVSISGYGLQGEGADLPAFDAAGFWSRGGVGGAMTPKGFEPVKIRPAFGDAVCALAVVSSALAAVVERRATGRGRLLEASLLRTATFAMGWDYSILLRWERLSSERPRAQALEPLRNYFMTADGRWIGIFPRDGRDEFAHLLKAIAQEQLAQDPRFAAPAARAQNGEALVAALDEGFAQLTAEEAGRRLTEADMIWGPLNLPRDTIHDPLALAAGCFVDIVDGDGVAYRQPASPVRVPGVDVDPKRPAPKLGEHTREVLAAAGYSDAEIDALFAEGAAA